MCVHWVLFIIKYCCSISQDLQGGQPRRNFYMMSLYLFRWDSCVWLFTGENCEVWRGYPKELILPSLIGNISLVRMGMYTI